MLELERAEAKITAAQPEVTEKGDSDNTLALDIDFELETSNDILLLLSKKLKSSFYRKQYKSEQEDEPQAELAVDPDNYMPVLLFPEIKKYIPWGYHSDGYTFTIHNNVDPEQIYETFEDCTLSLIKFLPRESGLVRLKFRVRCFPNTNQIGRVSTMLKTSPPISLVSPYHKGSD